MARVLVTLKIFPTDVNDKLEDIKGSIKKNLPDFASIYKFEEEPIAFGLVAIIAHILMPEDIDGAIDVVETNLKKIESIKDFQTQMVRRV